MRQLGLTIGAILAMAALCASGGLRTADGEPAPAPPPPPPPPAVEDDDPVGAILPPRPLEPPGPPGPPAAPGQLPAERPEGVHEAVWKKILAGEVPPVVYLGVRGQLAKFQVAAQDDDGHWQVRDFLTAVNQPVGEPVYLLRGNRKLFVNFATGHMFTAFEPPVMQGKKVVRPDGVTVSPRSGQGAKKFLPNLGPPDPVVDEAVRRQRQMIEIQMTALAEKCRHTDPDLRTSALLLLIRYLPDAEPHFVKLLTDEDVTIRTHTLLVLCATGQDFGWARLPEALQDRDPKMRAMALFLVTEFRRADMAHVIGTLCADEDERLRTLAVCALALQPGENKLFTLRKCLADPAPAVVVAAIRALAHAGDPQAGEAIGKKIFDGNPAIRLAALQAVPAWPTADNVERVLAALGDREPATRQAAATGLRRMTGIDAVTDAGLALDREPDDVQNVRRLQQLNQRWLKEKPTLKLSTASGRIGQCARIQPTPGKVESMAFSPDGKKLALGGTFILTVIDLPDGGETTYDIGTIATQMEFAPDGQSLYFRVRGPASQDLHRIAFGKVIEHTRFTDPQTAAKPTPGWRSLALSADGKTLFGLQADGRRVIGFDTATGRGEVLVYSLQATQFDRLALVTADDNRVHPGDLLVCGDKEEFAWLLHGKRFARLAEPCFGVLNGLPAKVSRTVAAGAPGRDPVATTSFWFPHDKRNQLPIGVDMTATVAWYSAGPLFLQRAKAPNPLRPPQALIDSLGLDKLMHLQLETDRLELKLRSTANGEVLGEYPVTASVDAMTATGDGRLVAFCSGGQLYVYQR